MPFSASSTAASCSAFRRGVFSGECRSPLPTFRHACRVVLTSTQYAAYTRLDASKEGMREITPDKTLDGDAVSRTAEDREAVFFCAPTGLPMGMLIRGGRVVDPSGGIDRQADVRVRDGRVAAVGQLEREPFERVVDADGLVVAPGLIDVHVHLREPGQEWKETIGSGTSAAAAGGFTTVFCMPNTEPALDSVVMLEALRRRCERDAVVRVCPIAAISVGRDGERAVDYDALAHLGAVGFSDDGVSTRDTGVMRQALDASRRLGVAVIVHCEEPGLTGGAMHDGDISRSLGVRGLPAEAEELVIARDLALAEQSGGWLHVCHVSTGHGAALIGQARADGARVTAEAMPHHLMMSHEWVAGSRRFMNLDEAAGAMAAPLDSNTKVNPPLRPEADTGQLLAALKDGTIDLVATDHAPHAVSEKQGQPLEAAAFGLSGSELALPLMLALVRAGHFALPEVIALLSTVPARLWGLRTGSLARGAPADFVLFDPDEVWEVQPDRLLSRGGNTPLAGMSLRGRVKYTFVDGEERYRDG
jgi:dihydroorotase